MADPVAVTALGIAVISLGWQAVTWRLGGERVSLSPRFEGTVDGHEVLSLDVRNSGRGPAQLTGARLVVGKRSGKGVQGGTELPGKELGGTTTYPVTVPGRSSVQLTYDAAKVCYSIKHHADLPAPGRIEATLGSGGRVSSRWWKELPVDAVSGEDPVPGEHRVRLRRLSEPHGRNLHLRQLLRGRTRK